MALPKFIIALVFVLTLARIELSTCQLVKAKVSCLDCKHNAFSGIKVLVKCDGVKKLAMATTEDDGSFEVELPSDTNSKSTPPLNCHAKLFAAPTQLYASRKTVASKIIKTKELNSYTISTPLSFATSCPSTYEKCKAMNKFSSSKNINLNLPPEWGLAPASLYIPYYPIISGIP